MGSGVAKAIRAHYPEAYQEYISHPVLNLGDVIFAKSRGKIIANGITQERYGYDQKQYVDYSAINKVIETTHNYALRNNHSYIAMPLIGAGLGGGQWAIISDIIESVCKEVRPVVYTLDGKLPD